MNAIVVYNETAGLTGKNSGTPSAESLRAAFVSAGIDAEIRRVTGSNLDTVLRNAAAQRPSILYVGGGDGTISAAAGLLAKTGITLGVIPLGTLNHFARDIGMPTAWREAVKALSLAPIRTVDVAEVNGRIFINNCSLGAYADAVRRRDTLRRQTGHGKWRAMIMASLAVFRELRRLSLQIVTPETSFSVRTPFVLVANNRYTGHVFSASLRPRVDGGRLWLYTTRANRHAAMIRLVWQSITRRIDEADELEFHSVSEATITVSPAFVPVAADGEVLDLKAPFHFKLHPAALQVLAPVPVNS